MYKCQLTVRFNKWCFLYGNGYSYRYYCKWIHVKRGNNFIRYSLSLVWLKYKINVFSVKIQFYRLSLFNLVYKLRPQNVHICTRFHFLTSLEYASPKCSKVCFLVNALWPSTQDKQYPWKITLVTPYWISRCVAIVSIQNQIWKQDNWGWRWNS